MANRDPVSSKPQIFTRLCKALKSCLALFKKLSSPDNEILSRMENDQSYANQIKTRANFIKPCIKKVINPKERHVHFDEGITNAKDKSRGKHFKSSPVTVDVNSSSSVQVNSEIVSTLSREFMDNDEKHVNSSLDSAAQASSTPVLLLAESSGDTVNMMPENDASTGVSTLFPCSGMSSP